MRFIFSKIARLLGVLLVYALKSGSVQGWEDQNSLTNPMEERSILLKHEEADETPYLSMSGDRIRN
jgi:hypothetical protein